MDKFTEQFDKMMEERIGRADTIAANLGVQDPLEKAISQNDFDDQYGKGFEVFEKDGLNRYVADLEKSLEGESEEDVQSALGQAAELIKGLTPVIIRTGEKSTKCVFVRKSASEEEAETE